MQTTERLPKLAPLVDVVFRRLFEDPQLLCSLLNAVLDLPPHERLISVTILPTNVAGPLADDKEVVLDIRAVTESGRQFHIEVQVRTFVAYIERMLFYWAGMYHGQLKTGQGYRNLEPVISVHILGFRLLPQEQKFAHYHHVFEILERRTGYRLSDHLELHTIEMPKFFKRPTELSTEEEKWLYFLEHGHELTTEQVQALGLPEIVEAEEKLRVISQDRVLRIQYEQRMKAQRDAVAWEKDHIEEWLDEGKKLGLDEGRREGKKLGLDEGKKLGLDEGRRQGEQVARAAIVDLCDAFAIELTPERSTYLETLELDGLNQLRQHLRQHRAWPA